MQVSSDARDPRERIAIKLWTNLEAHAVDVTAEDPIVLYAEVKLGHALIIIIIIVTIIIIIITRPKPPYGRQGLAGLWARIQSGGYILGRSQRLTSRLRRSARIG